MKALDAVNAGHISPGVEVWTFPIGEVPGGVWRVTELSPDPACPEIVFMVERHDEHWDGVIGVFEDEEIILIGQSQD